MKSQRENSPQQFPKEAYPVLQQYRKVANSLGEVQFRKKTNYKKLQQLERKVSCLSQKESIRYQRKLQKLQTTQNYATHLLKMKYQSFVQIEKDTSSKHYHCAAQKQKMAQSRRLSQSLFDKLRSERIQRVKAEKLQKEQDHFQKTHEMQIAMRRQTQKVRQQQRRAKQRKKRYEQFKLQQAALNYTQKLQNEYTHYIQRNKYLQDLKRKAVSEEQTFRKTQILNKQTAKIQSIYLTGGDC